MSRRNVVAFWLPSGTGFDHINLGGRREHSCATSSALPKLGFRGFSNRLAFAAGLKRFSKYKPTSWIGSKWARELQITFVPVFSSIHNFNSQSYYYKLNVCPSAAVASIEILPRSDVTQSTAKTIVSITRGPGGATRRVGKSAITLLISVVECFAEKRE